MIKIISFCTAKKTVHKTKREHTEQKKIFANNATNKGLISKIYKQLIKLRKTNKKTQSKNGQKISTTTKEVVILLQIRYTDGQQTYAKRLNTNIREMKIKTTMRLSPHPSQNGHH